MSTSFTFAEVPLFDGLSFWIDGNSKITWDNGTYADPRPNAFSLPHIATCPGSTPRCRESCYVHGLKKAAPEVYAKYELNEGALHSVLLTSGRTLRAAEILARWIATNAPGGFRWHVSGDVTGISHAHFIVEVCRRAPEVNFWIYTRTLQVVRTLTGAPNLAVNVSADKDNYAVAESMAHVAGARLCYLVSSPDEVIPALPPRAVIFPDYPLRGRSLMFPIEHHWWKALSPHEARAVCPADFFGQSEQHRCGPCKKCLRPLEAGR